MRNRILVGAFALASVINVSAFGAQHTAAASSRATNELVFGTDNTTVGGRTGGAFNFGGGTWSLPLRAEYHMQFMDAIQLGGQIMAGISGPTFAWNVGAIVGPTFNFGNSTAGDISDAMFIFAGAGVNLSNTPLAFLWSAEAGKRFKLWDNVSWKPSFRVNGNAGALTFAVNLINVSVIY